MIISPGRNYIFVHIPKTGGTSMALALEARAMKDDVMLGDTPKALKRRKRLRNTAAKGRLWKHATLADIDGLIPQAQIDAAFCFTMVRNPFDRMVSYYHWLRVQTFDHPARHLAQRYSFADFAQHPDILKTFKQSPARHYMTDASGIEHCQAYIRLEHLEEDLRPLETHLGFRVTLSRENISRRDADWRRYYTNSVAESVASAFAEDLIAFKYTFDG